MCPVDLQLQEVLAAAHGNSLPPLYEATPTLGGSPSMLSGRETLRTCSREARGSSASQLWLCWTVLNSTAVYNAVVPPQLPHSFTSPIPICGLPVFSSSFPMFPRTGIFCNKILACFTQYGLCFSEDMDYILFLFH